MSEPLYCPGCGDEIGPEHDDCDWWERFEAFDQYGVGEEPEYTYCEVCGVKEPCGCST